ncbi:MAG: response regulator [Verrucomicrobiales bacterium]|nr:response regulator [Verrucomicrobiales bacterium]
MKRQILLVDSDTKFAQCLANSLAAATNWEVVTATHGTEALVTLGKAPCDAIITDLRLSGADGAVLLNEVMRRHPLVHRCLLAHLTDKQGLLKCVGTAHQFMAKPCDATRLKAALERAFTFDLWLPGESVQRLVGQLKKLPSPPELFFRVAQALDAPDSSLETIGDLIARDVAITAKLLQLVNSAAFGLPRQMSEPKEAILHLGLGTTKSLILLAHCFSYFDDLQARDFSAEKLWQHSMRVSQLAAVIAGAENASAEVVDLSRTAGLLHDLGKIALAANLPKQFSEAVILSRTEHVPPWEADARVFGASHAEIGAALLATWGLVPDLVEALALHHLPAQLVNRGFCPLTAVHVANAFDHALENDTEPQVDLAYLDELGLSDRIPLWRELALGRLAEFRAAA